ncbi:helix-turn-helix transcriptional regulator [Actinoallomurus sp. NPDC050550]|uniref:helix-turn-helix domain-containing protein n=1 Tax=Actinoallomurus sp. NPDC050550 TaxID=3154937 RepID=UPI0033F1BF70
MNQYYTSQAIWGRELRHYRKAASFTQAQLAAKIFCSESLISSIETGQAPATPEFAKDADEALNTGGTLSRTLDWRKGAPAYPAWFVDWIPVEDGAVQLRVFEIDLIHGLLQTPDYACALLGGDEAAVEARLLRQSVLTRADPPPPALYCVLDESALRRNVGGAKVMYEQLQHLLKASERENVSIQVVPSRAHRGVRGPFAVGTSEDGSETAQADNAFGGAVSTRPEDLATVVSSWESIRTEALPADMSRDLIRKIAEELWST